MSNLNALFVYAKVVEAKSFSEAARRMGMPISTVSRKVAKLEDQLGVRLLERSTRKLRLTDIGANVLDQAKKSVEVSDAVESIVSNRLTEVKGDLRLSAPPSISDSILVPLVTSFQAAYPQVDVEILVTERFVDHIVEGIDLVFRAGSLKDSSLIAQNLFRFRHQLVASPAYLDRNKAPTNPSELLDHKLMTFSHWTPEYSWQLTNGSRKETITFKPHLAMNDYSGLAEALVSGAGIGELPPIIRPELIAAGRLVEVMPKWHLTPDEISIVHLSNRHVNKVVRLFKDFAKQMAPTLFQSLPN